VLIHYFKNTKKGKPKIFYSEGDNYQVMQRADEKYPIIIGEVIGDTFFEGKDKPNDRLRKRILDIYFKDEPGYQSLVKNRKDLTLAELGKFLEGRCEKH